MKTVKYILIGLSMLLALFYAVNTYIYSEKQADEVQPIQVGGTVTYSGVVSSVNRDAMAYDGPGLIVFETSAGESHTISVASMGRNLCTAKDAIADVYMVDPGDTVRVRGALSEDGTIVPCMGEGDYLDIVSMYSNMPLGFSFIYEKSPDGYTAQELLPANDPQFVGGCHAYSN